jgi:hypothetical protein
MLYAIVAVVVVTIGIGAWVFARRRATRRARLREIPLVFPLATRGRAVPNRPNLQGRERDPIESFRPGPAMQGGDPAWASRSATTFEPPATGTNGHSSHPPSLADRTPVRGNALVPEPAGSAPARAPGTIRYAVPMDGTLQFLPGRLEVLTGDADGREIRFVRAGGPDGTVITFGRAEGPPYRHVQLREPTVSRNHARMRFDGASWHLTNLSATNPVIVNGQELPAEGEPVTLQEGDQIEMGEVTFRFHRR